MVLRGALALTVDPPPPRSAPFGRGSSTLLGAPSVPWLLAPSTAGPRPRASLRSPRRTVPEPGTSVATAAPWAPAFAQYTAAHGLVLPSFVRWWTLPPQLPRALVSPRFTKLCRLACALTRRCPSPAHAPGLRQAAPTHAPWVLLICLPCLPHPVTGAPFSQPYPSPGRWASHQRHRGWGVLPAVRYPIPRAASPQRSRAIRRRAGAQCLTGMHQHVGSCCATAKSLPTCPSIRAPSPARREDGEYPLHRLTKGP